MAYQENQFRCNVEFLKSSNSKGRVIRLNHNPQTVPPQLAGRVDPQMWGSFMAEVEGLANRHPYVIKPSGKQVAGWAGCMAIGSCLGFCCINADGGDYGAWTAEVQHMVERWRPVFAQKGCMLSFVQQRNMYIQIDVDPNAPVQPYPQFKQV